MPDFDWQCHPEAEKWLHNIIERYKQKNPSIVLLEKELLEKSSTHLFDWIDHLIIEASDSVENELRDIGFEQECDQVFFHRGAQLPRVALGKFNGLAFKVECIADFLMVRGLDCPIEGSPSSGYRRALFSKEQGVSLFVIERRGIRALEPTYHEPRALMDLSIACERWKTRSRREENTPNEMEQALLLAQEIVNRFGKDRAASLILECERKYWQSRNSAAALQKSRQDSVGMGWANHDHHTFRSSRRYFASLVKLFETLGFHCRERYYAGAAAGWGAQIMENSVAGLILFLDVDLAPDEIEIDFAHEPLQEKAALGTVGLWCALHGESILKAGMHHLEAQFSFERLKQDLASEGIEMMDPFSNFAYLRQAFTKAEMWKVDPKRIERLVQQGLITKTQGEKFAQEGAIGSHLENLERHEGYKGFNKESVNLIIKKTDPRLSA